MVVIVPLAFLVPLREMQALFAPKSLDLLVVHPPAFGVEQLAVSTATVPAIRLRQPDHGEAEYVITLRVRPVVHVGTRHAHHATGAPLRRAEPLARMDDGPTLLLGRQAFGFEESRRSLRVVRHLPRTGGGMNA
ncbi:MAG: hypothetical protein AAF409_10390 [Pseudomonadota bacterium]